VDGKCHWWRLSSPAYDTATVKLLSGNGATLKNADMGVYLGQAVLDNNKDLIDDYN
jgi:hypothetical protein